MSSKLRPRSLHQMVCNHHVGWAPPPLLSLPPPLPSCSLRQADNTQRALGPELEMGLKLGPAVTPRDHLSCPFLRPTSGRSHPGLSSTVQATRSSPPWISTWSLLATPYQVKDPHPPPHPRPKCPASAQDVAKRSKLTFAESGQASRGSMCHQRGSREAVYLRPPSERDRTGVGSHLRAHFLSLTVTAVQWGSALCPSRLPEAL